MKSNQEKKQESWKKLCADYNHLENYCNIEATGLDDNNIYFHPKFTLDENAYISSQADVGTNNGVYALRFIVRTETDNINVEVYNELLEPIIVGYHTNKETVMIALTTLYRMKEHVRCIDQYVADYVYNVLIGNSIQEITRNFINELQTANKLVSFMQREQKESSKKQS